MPKGKYHKWLTDDGLLKLAAWARDGLTDEQIAHNIGISRSTLSDWKVKYPDISDAISNEKEVVDILVENALLKRAIGFEYDEVTYETTYAKNGKAKQREIKRVTKMVKPDVNAQKTWLWNRKRKVWRAQQIENTMEDTADSIRNWIEASQGGPEPDLFKEYEDENEEKE